ncbi:MAG: hypothetical protein JW847_07470 [Candidatus Omnitrophica bacterium]|nr:hypothetical protein [Candidatus Omnitrophota bacterium]
MYRNSLFDIFRDRLFYPWKHQFVHGLLFVFFGVMIIVFPQILAAMAASVFILIGFFLISSAWTLKHLAKERGNYSNEFYDWI